MGKYSELAAIHDDPVAYAKEYAEQLTKEEKETNTILVPFSVSKTSLCSELDGELEMASQPRDIFNVGYLYPSHVYTQCGMDKFFDSIKSNSKIKFDPDYINRMLCVSRIIAPASKLRTYNALSDLIEEPQKEIEYHQILRTLDVLCEHMDSYQEALYKGTLNVRERDTELIYYDCTNFYFEIEEEDEEFVHPVTGEIMPPLRRYGYSKEHRPNPLVQFGIMCDSDMIPIMMQVSPGSQNESLTAEPLEKKVYQLFKKTHKDFTETGKDVIFCCDAAMSGYDIRKYNSLANRKLVITQSIPKLPKTIQDAILSDIDYKLLSSARTQTDTKKIKAFSLQKMKSFDYAKASDKSLYDDTLYKTIPYDITAKLYPDIPDNDEKVTVKQQLIVTFSRKYFDYQRAIRQNHIDRAKKLIETKDPESYKKSTRDVKRFIKNVVSDKKGNPIPGATKKWELDLERIAEEEKWDGFYVIAHNLFDRGVPAVLNISNGRVMIEDNFRVMKLFFRTRPIFVHNPERITGHLISCFTALVIFRLMELDINEDKTHKHITHLHLLDTLKNLNVTSLDGMYVKSLYTGSVTLKALESKYNLSLDLQIHPISWLKKICGKNRPKT